MSLCFIGTLLYAQPKIGLKEGVNLNFGDVIAGEKITKEVTIMNSGKDTLHISDVTAQCGCTATLLKEKILAPGAEANLSITFNASGYRAGKVVKHVYVKSDDPETSTLTIEFQPNVIQLLELNPLMLSYNNAIVDTPMTKSLILKNTSNDTINILSIDNSFEFLKVAVGKTTLAPGDTTELSGTLLTPKPGSEQKIIYLLTDHPSIPKVEVKVFLFVNRK